MKLKEIETAFGRLKTCPYCKSTEGFWIGLKREHVYAQCKSCGRRFELLEIYKLERRRAE